MPAAGPSARRPSHDEAAAAAGGHLPALDGFRGLAVLLVLLSHFLEVGGRPHESFAGRLLLGGFVGVDMFFVLSGFLITGILLDCGIGRPGSYRAFYGRRLLRIFPLYFVSLGVVHLLAPTHGEYPWAYPLFASNLVTTWEGRWLFSPWGFDLGHFWSLAVEEQFYLFWPFIVARLSRSALVKLCLGCVVVGLLSHFAFHFAGNAVGAYQFTTVRLPTLAIGAWLAIAARDPRRWAGLRRRAPWVAGIAGLASIVSLLFPDRLSLMLTSPWLWGAGLVLATTPGPCATALSARPLTFLGKLSYGLYVLHYLAYPQVVAWLYQGLLAPRFGHGWTSTLLFTVLALALSLAAALISWHVLESPLLALKRHFRYPAAAASAPAPASTDSKTPPPSSLPPS